MKRKNKLIFIIVIIILLVVFLLMGYLIGKNNESRDYKLVDGIVTEHEQNYVENVTHPIDNTKNLNTVNDMENMSEEDYQKALKEKSINNVSIKVREETITKKGATFIITDKNKIHYLFGQYYRIDKRNGNKWEYLKPISDETIWELTAWTSIYDEYDYKVDWSKIYGELECGEYRIMKEIDNMEIYAEFIIK